MTHRTRYSIASARICRAAFTLMELMISIAIVLVLMLGINFVFGTSAKTISTGMAVTAVSREIRGARKVLENDFLRAVPGTEMPGLLIHNEVVYAWRDKNDKLTDQDGDPTTYDVDGDPGNGDEIDLSPNGDATGLNPAAWSPTTPAPYGNLPGVFNQRRHRIDRISFYAKNTGTPYARQTGDANTYVNGETSTEAWIQYSLLRIADNSGLGYWKPGARGDKSGSVYPDEQANQNNFFTSQWQFGRRVTLLKDPAKLGVGATYYQTPYLSFAAQARRVTQSPMSIPPQTFQSVPFNRENPPYPNATPWIIPESRVDLAGTTITQMRDLFSPTGALGAIPWWNDADPTTTTASTNRDRRDFDDPLPGITLNYLSWAKPFVDKTNFATSVADQTRETALTTPLFMRGVSQFIVEFAGDFYDQGNISAGLPEPIGTIDYVPDAATGGFRIRWYGMPRETDGVPGIAAGDTQPVAVAPLASPFGGTPVAKRYVLNSPHEGPERQRMALTLPYVYVWNPTVVGGDPVGAIVTPPTAAVPGNSNNVRPSLIRFTLEVTDANGRMEEGQRMEFVFRVK
jgi:prepilin-type N-terminal cleavage/methylation domain-containing protein